MFGGTVQKLDAPKKQTPELQYATKTIKPKYDSVERRFVINIQNTATKGKLSLSPAPDATTILQSLYRTVMGNTEYMHSIVEPLINPIKQTAGRKWW
jgi:hypothetical protein